MAISRPTMMAAGYREQHGRIVLHQHDQGDGDHELVGHRVEKGAENGRLLQTPGKIAIEPVGHRGQTEDGGAEQV